MYMTMNPFDHLDIEDPHAHVIARVIEDISAQITYLPAHVKLGTAEEAIEDLEDTLKRLKELVAPEEP